MQYSGRLYCMIMISVFDIYDLDFLLGIVENICDISYCIISVENICFKDIEHAALW